MAPTEENLADWAREVRNVESLEADIGVLQEVRSFLQSHEAEHVRDATHVVLENFPDWWVRGRRAPSGLSIVQEEDLEELFLHAGVLYGLGIPLTLAERRTPSFRFFQDIEVWGTRETSMPSEELVGPDRCLTTLIGEVIGEVFTGREFLDAAVYDATGLSQTKGVRKTSLRVVWPGITVDSDRAARVRDFLVHRLTTAAADGGPVAQLEAQLREQSPAAVNGWHSVLTDAAYGGRSHVRMPLCDRVSPLPLRAAERRPFSPVGVLRFSYPGEGKMKAEWLCRQGELDYPEWVKIGCLRQGAEAALTDWTAPSWPTGQPVLQSATRGGRVKVRTAGGSDGGGGLRLRAATRTTPAPDRAGQILTVERHFAGTADKFCESMEQHLGKATAEVDGSFVWRQPGGDARIVMHVEDKRVKVIGRPNQVRSLVVLVSPLTEPTPALGPANRMTGPGPLPDGRTPSAAYAPNRDDGITARARDGMEPDPRAGAMADTKEDGTLPQGQQLRVAKQGFESQGQGELALVQGETVLVTHDPEDSRASGQDRWVYGKNEATGACGWFPLSHTEPAAGQGQQG